MKLKVYAIIISVVAAALLASVIALALKPAGISIPVSEVSTQAVLESAETKPPEPESTSAKETVPEETTVDESIYNVGGAVGWEAGNNDSLNVINAWKNMLKQMDVDADIAFLGDSITHRGDFRPYFPDTEVINLGCGGDTIRGVYNRAEMLSYVHAEEIVVMCGVNMLRDDKLSFCRTEYGGLLNAIQEYSPDSKVYVCSILPMSKDWQDAYCSRTTTEEFNEIIKDLAEDRGMTYVDLYPLFEEEGEIKPELTVDGVHLSGAGYELWMSALKTYMVD